MSAWADLDREAERWSALGRAIEFWWRDDDASADTPALRQLVERDWPIALAVIPAAAKESLRDLAARYPRIAILQHGVSHKNSAGAGEKKNEFPDRRTADEALTALLYHKKKLASAYGEAFLPVLTPPWNRIGPILVSRLAEIGFVGLSTYRARKSAWPAPGLFQVNTHVDVIDWRGSRGFIGEEQAIGMICEHLAAKREGRADPKEPTGLLTHHLVHDTETWRFLDRLGAWSRSHPHWSWRRANEIFLVSTKA